MFENRSDAGRKLAARLQKYRDRDPIVVALPRGGVPVGYEVARALGAPLDVLVVRKIGAPGQPEFGLGAIAQGGATYLNEDVVQSLGVSQDYVDAVTRKEAAEMVRRIRAYRGNRPPLDVTGRTVLLVDDGLATGVTTRAAIRALRQQAPREVILAVPVCAPESARELRAEFDEVICASSPEHFRAVGLWYVDFEQTTDEEVVALLARAERERTAAKPAPLEARPPAGYHARGRTP